ncbi:hypothetical protein PAHAL_1G110800 [Panicum hallii]|jgi:hypothetical protein|uniref:Uncharacterized protein n=1 Tax=Panicum hallii TaxID=206008 RepID=A0A2S3GNG7_9POAL|nr:uncharacterized protein LOC112879042 [Panicum hallii]PAN05052.1 hypothetical protein PAHAL_1G110800 [Panicum hallii]
MALLGDALLQAFLMPQRAYAALRDDEHYSLPRLRRPLVVAAACCVAAAVAAAACVSLGIVFPAEPAERPFCRERRMLEALPAAASSREEEPEAYRYRGGAFYMTTAEAADFYWMVVFVPSAVLFGISLTYLVAGMSVAYAAPRRHPMICVVENNFCASRRGGVRCLAILNAVFAVVFGLMAIVLGSTLLALGSTCSVPLFWCYEITAWGLAILYGGTAFFLRRKAAVVLDEGDYATHNVGLEMLESKLEVTPEMQRRISDGFKQWMGSSHLSSDDEDEASDDYIEHNVPSPTALVEQHRRENDLET